ncbi:MAG: hypothetical protein J0L81_08575 [Caulobacterales bacterium]|nr:hypothetical protein [Caulobacterales bacterium]
MPPLGVILFCIAYAVPVAIGAFWVFPRYAGDWISFAIMIVTCFAIGQSLRGFWLGQPWAVAACAVFLVLLEAGLFLAGPADNLIAVIVRTAAWLGLLLWAYRANRSYFHPEAT